MLLVWLLVKAGLRIGAQESELLEMLKLSVIRPGAPEHGNVRNRRLEFREVLAIRPDK